MFISRGCASSTGELRLLNALSALGSFIFIITWSLVKYCPFGSEFSGEGAVLRG